MASAPPPAALDGGQEDIFVALFSLSPVSAVGAHSRRRRSGLSEQKRIEARREAETSQPNGAAAE